MRGRLAAGGFGTLGLVMVHLLHGVAIAAPAVATGVRFVCHLP